MKAKISLLAAVLVLSLVTQAQALTFQDKFDYLGPEMKHFTNSAGRELIYIDEGPQDGQVVVFFGGACTSAQAFYLTEFARTLRTSLKLRIISLERNGFGQTTFVPDQNYADYVADLKELLTFLKVDKFETIAISGGGPYMSLAAEEMADRVTSLHFAAAYSYVSVDPLNACKSIEKDPEKFKNDVTDWVHNPMVWWDLGKNTSVHKIPAFQDTANNEGAHSFFIRGQMGDPVAALHEYTNLCTAPTPKEASKVKVPVYLYYGEADKSVTPKHAEFWQKHYAGSSKQTLRLYPGEGHDVQYRHWDQILLDLAGHGDKVLICEKGKASLEAPDKADAKVKEGKATLGLCAWQ